MLPIYTINVHKVEYNNSDGDNGQIYEIGQPWMFSNHKAMTVMDFISALQDELRKVFSDDTQIDEISISIVAKMDGETYSYGLGQDELVKFSPRGMYDWTVGDLNEAQQALSQRLSLLNRNADDEKEKAFKRFLPM